LHRIGSVELRVISDIDAGVLPIIQEEERVIRAYTQRRILKQRMVSLFILQDLQPLVSQIQAGGAIPPGDTANLERRAMINVYDLADPSTCNIFINQQVMVAAGYWGDLVAIRGLLAHEHAHPLAENATTLASRQLQLESDPVRAIDGTEANRDAADLAERIERILADLLDQLCLRAPREIFTNELAITNGFADALLHLNRQNVANAVRSLAGRGVLQQQIEQAVAQGQRSESEAKLLLLIGDLQSYINLAMEIAPFYRAGRDANARELEQTLEQDLFPHLAPAIGQAYTAICGLYVALPSDLGAEQVQIWSQEICDVVSQLLGEQQMLARQRLTLIQTAAPNTRENDHG
jgi:hypothetical protein